MILSEERVWQELLENKYLRKKTLCKCKLNPWNSPFWKGIMGVKDDLFQGHSPLAIMLDLRNFLLQEILRKDVVAASCGNLVSFREFRKVGSGTNHHVSA
jgi:hypothetical protein